MTQPTCNACKTEIQGLIDYLNASNSSDVELVPNLLERVRFGCQELILGGVLESDDFESVAARHRRLRRLIELNAPEQIIEHEFKWLKRMAGILLELAEGQQPIFTAEEQEEFEFHRVLNESFEDSE
jgi:hypothetical protein